MRRELKHLLGLRVEYRCKGKRIRWKISKAYSPGESLIILKGRDRHLSLSNTHAFSSTLKKGYLEGWDTKFEGVVTSSIRLKHAPRSKK